METTNLQKIAAHAADYLKEHIERAIDSGAEIKSYGKTGIDVDGLFLMDTRKAYGKNTFDIVLHIDSESIAKAFDKATEPTQDELTERAEELRAELKEIENQLKEKEANDETNND